MKFSKVLLILGLLVISSSVAFGATEEKISLYEALQDTNSYISVSREMEQVTNERLSGTPIYELINRGGVKASRTASSTIIKFGFQRQPTGLKTESNKLGLGGDMFFKLGFSHDKYNAIGAGLGGNAMFKIASGLNWYFGADFTIWRLGDQGRVLVDSPQGIASALAAGLGVGTINRKPGIVDFRDSTFQMNIDLNIGLEYEMGKHFAVYGQVGNRFSMYQFGYYVEGSGWVHLNPDAYSYTGSVGLKYRF